MRVEGERRTFRRFVNKTRAKRVILVGHGNFTTVECHVGRRRGCGSGGSSISQVSQATNVTKSANIINYIQYQFVLAYKTILIEDSPT